MAHNVETMAYSGEVPWHGLGRRVSNDLTPYEILEAAELNWKVIKTPIYYNVDELSRGTVPNKFALIRESDGCYFDTVGPKWRPLQNDEAFQFFHDFVEQGEMEMHTAGSLQSGKIVWALAKIKESFTIVNEDLIDQYILFVNPHKRGKAIEVRSTNVRVVCNNTMDFALESDSARRITVAHNQAWDEDYVKEMMHLAHHVSSQYAEKAELLASKQYTQPDFEDYVDEIFPNTGSTDERSRNANRTLEVVHDQPGSKIAEGSWWQAFNAVTFLTDHEMGRTTDTRLTSAWFGLNRTRKAKALNRAVDYAKAA